MMMLTASIAVGVSGCGAGIAARHESGLEVTPSHAAPVSAPVRQPFLLGHSVGGRPIRVEELGYPSPARRILVVGCIHGNEPAGIAVTKRLRSASIPAGVALWVLDDMNPDGVALRTRQNGRGVDLNRNFPFDWRRVGQPGDQQYPGPRPLSEPEARIAYQLILRIHPQVTIFFHQPLDLVDESGGDRRLERRLARLTGLPLRRLPRYPGSAVGWQDHRLPGTTAFVVELGPGSLTTRAAEGFANAIVLLSRTLGAPAAG